MEIIMFYGKDCPHCHRMMPFIDQIKKEEDIDIGKRKFGMMKIMQNK